MLLTQKHSAKQCGTLSVMMGVVWGTMLDCFRICGRECDEAKAGPAKNELRGDVLLPELRMDGSSSSRMVVVEVLEADEPQENDRLSDG